MSYFNHSTATIDPDAIIGEGTKIWHYSHISSNAKIGTNVSIGQNVYIAEHAQIGKGCKIQNNVSVYDNVILEDDVFCGPSVVFTNVINPRAFISRKEEYLETIVKKGATLGANSTIVCGKKIGAFSFIGAGAVITKDVPDFALVVGTPGKHVGWVTKEGKKINLPLEGNGQYVCPETNLKYELIDGLVYIAKDN